MHASQNLFSKVFIGILFVGFGLAGCGSSSSEVSVPNAVLQAFNAKYPGVNPQWEEQPYGYEAVFLNGGVEYEAEYSATGEWLETEYEVPESQFSAAVLQRVRQQYPGYAITKYEIELTPQGTFYEVEIEGNGQEAELYFNEQAQPTANSNEDA